MANKSNITPKRAKKSAIPSKGTSTGQKPTQKPKVKPKAKKPTTSKPKSKPKPPKETNQVGRPEIYTPELADRICAEIATSQKSLRTICKQEGMPSVETILRWLREDKEGFCGQYARAKEEQSELMVEDMLEIADDGSNDYMTIEKGDKSYNVEDKEVTNRSRLRIDTRKWIASKLKPKKYGDKLDVETTNKVVIVGYEEVKED